MVRRARLYTTSGPDDRGATPGQLSTIPTASAARIVFNRAGDAEIEEPAVQQLVKLAVTLTGRGSGATSLVTWPEQNPATPVLVPRRHWAGPRPSRPVACGKEMSSFG